LDFWEILKREKKLDNNKDEWIFETSIINILMSRRFNKFSTILPIIRRFATLCPLITMQSTLNLKEATFY
jgi:hypothetical protein